MTNDHSMSQGSPKYHPQKQHNSSSQAFLALFLGGASSGKSAAAIDHGSQMMERLGETTGVAVVTANPDMADEGLKRKIHIHQQQRGEKWRTVCGWHDLPSAIAQHAHETSPIVVDCLSLWASLLVEAPVDEQKHHCAHLVKVLTDTQRVAPIWIVSLEVGLGVIPPYPQGRVYQVLLGELNSCVAQHAHEVRLYIAGLPLMIRHSGQG